MKKVFFGNSGAEANECAIKLARLWAKRGGNGGFDIVCLNKSFHGRTMETIAATMQGWAQDPFQPLPGGFLAIDANDVDALRAVFEQRGSNICAVMLEPIQGESGVHPMTPEFMAEVRRLTSEHGALMMCDEVQTGLFRTGHALAFQGYDVVPDVFTLAKAIAGGVPMGACVAKAEISGAFKPGDHGSTFGGGPLACSRRVRSSTRPAPRRCASCRPWCARRQTSTRCARSFPRSWRRVWPIWQRAAPRACVRGAAVVEGDGWGACG